VLKASQQHKAVEQQAKLQLLEHGQPTTAPQQQDVPPAAAMTAAVPDDDLLHATPALRGHSGDTQGALRGQEPEGMAESAAADGWQSSSSSGLTDTAVPDTAVPDTAVPDTAVPDTAVLVAESIDASKSCCGLSDTSSGRPSQLEMLPQCRCDDDHLVDHACNAHIHTPPRSIACSAESGDNCNQGVAGQVAQVTNPSQTNDAVNCCTTGFIASPDPEAHPETHIMDHHQHVEVLLERPKSGLSCDISEAVTMHDVCVSASPCMACHSSQGVFRLGWFQSSPGFCGHCTPFWIDAHKLLPIANLCSLRNPQLWGDAWQTVHSSVAWHILSSSSRQCGDE
jgi:hypothetical protein